MSRGPWLKACQCGTCARCRNREKQAKLRAQRADKGGNEKWQALTKLDKEWLARQRGTVAARLMKGKL